MCALGLEKSIVGRSQHCLYPASIKTKPIVVKSRAKKIAKQDSEAIHQAVAALKKQGAHQFEIDVKALKRLKPDLVVTQEICAVCAASHSEVSQALRGLSPKPQVVSLNAQHFDELPGEIRKLGIATGREKKARQITTQLEERIARIKKQAAKADQRPKVWCCEWLEPLMAAGHWIPEMVEIAGGADGLGPKGKDSRWLTWEEVRRFNPDVVAVMPCSYSIPQIFKERGRLTSRPGWGTLPAVKSSKVFAVDGTLYHHAGPRLVDGLELFAHLFHPELFPAEKRFSFYRPLKN